MDKFFKSCRRCLNPWVLGVIFLVVTGLIIFIPVVGIASLAIALPLIGCTVMCGAIALFMRGEKGYGKQ